MDIKSKAEEIGKLKGITMAYLNVRSLFKNLDEIGIFLKNSNVDVLLLGETFLNQAVDSIHLQIQGYRLHRFDRDAGSGKRGGGGLAAYIRNHYNFEVLNEWQLCCPDIEYFWLKLNLPDTRPTFISCIYRPPSGNAENALQLIENKIEDIYTQGFPDIVILGDFNFARDLLSGNEPNNTSDASAALSRIAGMSVGGSTLGLFVTRDVRKIDVIESFARKASGSRAELLRVAELLVWIEADELALEVVDRLPVDDTSSSVPSKRLIQLIGTERAISILDGMQDVPPFYYLRVAELANDPEEARRMFRAVEVKIDASESLRTAAMVDYINSQRAHHILTVEDPVEFVHPYKKGVVNQRELKRSTKSYNNALKGALRQDPDVIVIGEVFAKKTQKTPKKVIDTCKRRFKFYDEVTE